MNCSTIPTQRTDPCLFACPRAPLLTDSKEHWSGSGWLLAWTILLVVEIVPLTIVGGMSHFHAQASTAADRAWTMTWLVANLLSALVSFHRVDLWDDRISVVSLAVLTLLITPALGGYITLGQMLDAWGSC